MNKKTLCDVFQISAMIGAFMAAVMITLIYSPVLFYIGLALFVVGLIGSLVTGKRTGPAIAKLFSHFKRGKKSGEGVKEQE